MSIDENCKIVQLFCEALSARDVDAMFEHFSATGRWRMIGRQEQCPFGRTHSRDEAYQQLSEFLPLFDEFQFEVISTTAEDNRVAVQAQSRGCGPGNKQYKNRYMMLYQLEGGKIVSVDEYFDPLEVFAYMEMAE